VPNDIVACLASGQRVTISTVFPSPVDTQTPSLQHRATRMASDPVTEFLNKGYVEARALYEDDKLGEAIERCESLLEDTGIAQIFTNEDFLLTADRYPPISSHQMLPDDRGMRG